MKLAEVKIVFQSLASESLNVTFFFRSILELAIFKDSSNLGLEIKEVVTGADIQVITRIMDLAGDIDRLLPIDAALAKDQKSKDYLACTKEFVAELQEGIQAGINAAFDGDDPPMPSSMPSPSPSPILRPSPYLPPSQPAQGLSEEYRPAASKLAQLGALRESKQLIVPAMLDQSFQEMMVDLTQNQLVVFLDVLLVNMSRLPDATTLDQSFYMHVLNEFLTNPEQPSAASHVPSISMADDPDQLISRIFASDNVTVPEQPRGDFYKRFKGLTAEQKMFVVKAIEPRVAGEKDTYILEQDFFDEVWQQFLLKFLFIPQPNTDFERESVKKRRASPPTSSPPLHSHAEREEKKPLAVQKIVLGKTSSLRSAPAVPAEECEFESVCLLQRIASSYQEKEVGEACNNVITTFGALSPSLQQSAFALFTAIADKKDQNAAQVIQALTDAMAFCMQGDFDTFMPAATSPRPSGEKETELTPLKLSLMHLKPPAVSPASSPAGSPRGEAVEAITIDEDTIAFEEASEVGEDGSPVFKRYEAF